MAKKEIAIKTIEDLPDSATWADIEERIRFLAGIDKGLEDIKAGRVVPYEQVKETLKRRFAGRRNNLHGLVDGIPEGHRDEELGWGGMVGKEAW
jgi:predicted transcriptional regulator